MKIIDVTQGTHEWAKWRNTGVGASDSPIILMGESYPFEKTPYQLFESKLSGESKPIPEFLSNKGKETEDFLRTWFSKEYFHVAPMCCQMESEPLLASLDGFSILSDRPNGHDSALFEAKYMKKEFHSMMLDGEAPEIYNIQIQHAMLVSESPVCFLVSLNESFSESDQIKVLEVKADPDLQDRILLAAKMFWGHVQRQEPPVLLSKDWVEADPSLDAVAMEYFEAQNQIAGLEAKMDELKIKLVEGSGHDFVKGRGFQVRRYFSKGRVKYDDIPELENVDLERYRGDGYFSWKVTKTKG